MNLRGRAPAPFGVRAFVAAVALLLVAGCSRIGAGGAGGGGNPWTHHGVLRIVNVSEPDNLDPLVGNQQIDSDLALLWGGFFYEYSDQNQLVPDLVTDVPTLENGGISRDGKTIVYHLRKGVKWQDGAPFGAADVLFTWHAILNKNNNIPSTSGYDLIDRIEDRGDGAIAVHLKRRYAPFVNTFFTQSGDPYPVLPAHVLAKYPSINDVAFNSQPVGTGPFKVERWQRGSKIVFVANPSYWRGPPKLSRIEYTAVPSDSTIVTLLQAHDEDLEYNAAVADYPEMKSIPGTSVVLTPFDQYAELALNLASPVLADVRVRRALRYATDVPAILRDVTYGVEIPADSDQPKDSWAHDDAVTTYPYDLAKAKALLQSAGWIPGPDGVRVNAGRRLALTVAINVGEANGYKTSVLLQRLWAQAGVDVSIKQYVTSKYFATYGAGGVLQTGKFDVAFFGWISGIDPDDSVTFGSDQFPPAGQNVYHFSDPQVDAAIRTELADSDRRARERAFATIQERLAQAVPLIVVWFNRRITVENTDLKNYRPAHFVTSFWNAWEWSI